MILILNFSESPYFDVLADNSVTDSNPKPVLHTLTKPTYKVHVPLHSGVIQAFVKTSNPTEVSYYPIQAVRKCFR